VTPTATRRSGGTRLAIGLVVLLCTQGCRPAAPELLGAATRWLLIAPPNYYRDGAARMAERAPLWDWTRLGSFADEADCRAYRDDRIATSRGDDEEWAMWSLSRCETDVRAAGPRLTPDEEADGR
jgi:hypothetical protein